VEQKWYNNGTSSTTDDFKYGYDRNSNVLWRTNEINHNFDELYHANGSSNGYDNLNQLTAFARGQLNANHDTISSPSHSINYTLDAEGNFSSTQTDGGTAVNRTHNKQNEVTGVGSNTLTFDANGNLTKDDAGQQYVYDAWNRLVAVKNSGGTTIVSYQYDGLSRRIVENPGTVHDLYYDAAWQVLEERWGGVSTATIQYVWSPVYIDALVLRDRSTANNGTLDERLWVQQDANYNVTALINGSGSVVERYEYDPYGKQTVLDASFNTRSGSSYAFNIGFQGLRLDTTSGLYNARMRDFHPNLGRWVQADPLGFSGGDTNLYRALADSPGGATDPSGLDWHWQPGPWYDYLAGVPTLIRLWTGPSEEDLKKPLHPKFNPDQTDRPGLKAGDVIDAETRVWADDAGRQARIATVNTIIVAGTLLLPAPEEIVLAKIMAKVLGKLNFKVIGTKIFCKGKQITKKQEEIIVREFEKALKEEVKPTLDRIAAGKRHTHIGDGTEYLNKEGFLPKKPEGYYREYVHSSSLTGSPGNERIIVGEGGEVYYFTTHYLRPPIPIK
jgi:RHS repeat-associated protein